MAQSHTTNLSHAVNNPGMFVWISLLG